MMSRGRADSWTADEIDRLRLDYPRFGETALLVRFPGKTRGMIRGKAIRLQLKRPPTAKVRRLRFDNPALAEARTVFPGRVRGAGEAPEILVSGRWHRKLGVRVSKGPWQGMPIFALTLEERATCPSYCQHWRSCMGSAMQWAWRVRRNADLVPTIARDLARLQGLHPKGFVVRLHILGDFYAAGYVAQWARWLDEFPALHVFGYTAWHPTTSTIGRAVADLAAARWNRFAVRWSTTEPGPDRAVTIWAWDPERSRDEWRRDGVIVCPAETGDTLGCGSCGLCWSQAARDKAIGFIAHGAPGRKRASP